MCDTMLRPKAQQYRPSQDKCTRTRLLNRLGLFHQSQKHFAPSRIQFDFSRPQSRSALGNVVPFEATLKESGECSSPSANTTVQFNETVSVVNIPSRYQYSDRMKKFLWSDRWELQEMAERNMIEFEAEGFDWRNVVLDDEMYIDSVNGQLIHPCHLDEDPLEDTKHDNSFAPLGRQDSFVGSYSYTF